MQENTLSIQMFGELSIQWEKKSIRCTRSGKPWLLLAYLIHHRGQNIPQEKLFDLLWGEDESSDDPQNALKAVIHRSRKLLDGLSPTLGKHMIHAHDGSVCWAKVEDIQVTVDTERFEQLLREAKTLQDTPHHLETLLHAAELYQGEFLSRFSSESWVVSDASYYHTWYLNTVDEALSILDREHMLERAAELCHTALELEPFSEKLYWHLLNNIMESGNFQRVVHTYETLQQKYFAQMGTELPKEIRDLYHQALSRLQTQTISPENLHQQMEELVITPGAMICEYDFFRLLYQVYARSLLRSGETIHIGLLTMQGKHGESLSRRVLDHAVEGMLKQIHQNLRNGDVTARCSVSQVILMLPLANYENSCMVCERAIRSFRRNHPHSPVEITYFVQVMEPFEAGRRRMEQGKPLAQPEEATL